MKKQDLILEEFLKEHSHLKFTITISKTAKGVNRKFEVTIRVEQTQLVWTAIHSDRNEAVRLAILEAETFLETHLI
jgi:ribosome-associated translation inhibitor RaiA